MLNFFFEGKIGEMLAPVTGTQNKLFLAIQHQKNDTIQSLINEAGDISRVSEGGLYVIHAAAKFNNFYAMDLVLKYGVDVNLKDVQGNTALHHAARNGNLDMVKVLVERGCSVLAKNNSNQTAYDVSEAHHFVRQYLLPLQFQAESAASYGSVSEPMGVSTNAHYMPSYGLEAVPSSHPSPPTVVPSVPVAVPPSYPIAQAPAPMPRYGGVPSASTASSTPVTRTIQPGTAQRPLWYSIDVGCHRWFPHLCLGSCVAKEVWAREGGHQHSSSSHRVCRRGRWTANSAGGIWDVHYWGSHDTGDCGICAAIRGL